MMPIKTIIKEYLSGQIRFLLAKEKLSKKEERHLDWMIETYFHIFGNK